MLLIDTSSWIESLREKGKLSVRQRVNALLLAGEAAWCDMVRLELWNGARGDAEKNALADLEATVINLPIDDTVWQLSMQLARQARKNGWTVPAADILIVACAARHGVGIEQSDRHLDPLYQLI